MYNAKKMFLTAVSLLGISVVAHADTLAAGAAYGGTAQTLANCYLYNAGTGPVTVTSNVIIREPNVSVPLTFHNCAALAAGSICAIAANIQNNVAHACRMVISPGGADVRGTLEIRDASGRILNAVELR